MSEQRDVLGLGFMRVYKFYMKVSNSRENYLISKGLEVLDDGVDEKGEYFIVATRDPEMAAAIENEHAARPADATPDAGDRADDGG